MFFRILGFRAGPSYPFFRVRSWACFCRLFNTNYTFWTQKTSVAGDKKIRIGPLAVWLAGWFVGLSWLGGPGRLAWMVLEDWPWPPGLAGLAGPGRLPGLALARQAVQVWQVLAHCSTLGWLAMACPWQAGCLAWLALAWRL